VSDLATTYRPGSLIRARGREWVVLPESREDTLRLRPIGGSDDDATLLYLPLEPHAPEPATFRPPDAQKPGSRAAGLLLRDSLRLKLRAGAGPFRSFGNISVEPRAYQLVPLLMALRMDTIRLLIADDVGVGKTIEAGLIARELLDRGEITRMTVVCPPHLCEQWQQELSSKFGIQAEVVRTGTAGRLERGLPAGQSIFDVYPFTVVSLDYIKADRRRAEFLRACPDFVIVEEAHTCVQGGNALRHQRYQLLRGLAEDPNRHMVFLTATPHSGDEEAFHNLLGLLDPAFKVLYAMPEGDARQKLRERLALHFVQRRRPDIREWKDEAVFPDRETAEVTYVLSGNWGRLFDEVLDYARTMVRRAEGKSLLHQRMNWWAALALLRCISSSPASASIALRTRLKSAEGMPEQQQVIEIDLQGAETVLDGEASDLLNFDENVPAGTTEDVSISDGDAAALRALLERAENLKGPKNDPKLAVVIAQVRKLLADGFKPVIFCRYIATAHYVAEHLAATFKSAGIETVTVTGELAPDERRDKIALLGEAEGAAPILVATDCLSEGINLQNLFNAVVHYDLTWNPTRHEQREGRVDRFGQPSPVVRALMMYGENNPVDGAVLKVILRKAERIRKELGVSVPMPADNNKVMETIMQTVLLRTGGIAAANRQLQLDFGKVEAQLDADWESAKETAKQSQTIFAQRRLRPDDVLPEWSKAVSALGGEEDVERFLRTAAERLGTPLEPIKGGFRLPVGHLPKPLQERLEMAGFSKAVRFGLRHPVPSGFEHVHRAHPLVVTLADYVAERALAEEVPDLAARCGALVTTSVSARTTVFLLRLRNQLGVEVREGTRFVPKTVLLSEECLGVAVRGSGAPEILSGADALKLMAAEPVRNMDKGEQEYEIADSLDMLIGLEPRFDQLARRRAEELLADHMRVREASQAKGIRYSVTPCLPVDVIGAYVLLP
jgi:superfamily II DNA or RNA helicase